MVALQGGLPTFYGVQSWLVNAAPIGVVTKAAAENELGQLPTLMAMHVKIYRKNL